MKTNFMPQTRLGKWATGFAAGFFAYFLFLSPILMGLNQWLAGNEIIMNIM